MIPRLFAALAACTASLACAASLHMPSRPAMPSAVPAARQHFVAPGLAPGARVRLAAPREKAAPAQRPGRPVAIGFVRALDKSLPVVAWVPFAGGFVAKVEAGSEGAAGLRVELELAQLPAPLEVRVKGAGDRVESEVIEAGSGSSVWTPWTEGASQTVELFTAIRPRDADIAVNAVLHFTASPLAAKMSAGVCTLETMCAASDTSLAPGEADAIGQGAKSSVKILFNDNRTAYVCSATLLDTEKFPAAYLATANHCVDDDAVAATVTTLWFYDSDASCPDQGIAPDPVQLARGTQLVFTNYDVDSTLLLMQQAPPDGAIYAGWNATRLAPGDAIVSVSHPQGDTARYAVGSMVQEYHPVSDWPEPMYGVRFSRGIIQGGSSGSGLFTLSGGALELRGILTGTTTSNTTEGMSCTDLNESALYSRFDILAPQLLPFISKAGVPPDDAPNRPQDLFGVPPDPTRSDVLNERATPLALDARRIDYAGDLDVYRFYLSAPAWVSTWTEGPNIDTVGNILDSAGVNLAVNDDAQVGDNHFGITKRLDAGTYYVQVSHWDPAGTGPYNFRMRADYLDTNYTDLWWNSTESGWGINLNHQGNIVFATLFTYDESGQPMWLVMSDGERQPDTSYAGTLYRSTGPAFNASPFGPVSLAPVGTMRLAFTTDSSAELTYTYQGTTVTKAITRQLFSTPATCTWSAFDRSYSTNFQDLWWNPAEPGWGVNITHQGDILFATLFTYDANGQGMWLVMSNGQRTGTAQYSGTLYRTSGPRFDASPWTPVSLTPVGDMSFWFTNGNAGTMTYTVNGVQVVKSIQRQVFAPLRPDCGS